MKWEHQIRSVEMSVQSDHLLTLLSKAKQCRLLRDDCYISSQLVTSCITHRNDTRADLQPREESLRDRPSSMACLNYATFLVLLCLMKGAIAGSVATGSACTVTSDCSDTTSVCVPTVLKCLIKPSAPCSTADDKCVIGSTCSGNTPTCSSCDTTKHIAATPNDYCRLKLDQSCSASTAPCLDNGECVSSTCKCKTGYFASADKLSCIANIAVDTACAYATDTCVTGALCDQTLNKCGYKSGVTCASAAGKCVTGATCATTSDACVCTAASGFVARTDGYCGLISGKSCTSKTPCVDNAECSTSGTCACKSGYTAKTDGTCSGAVGLVGSFVLLMAAIFTATRLR